MTIEPLPLVAPLDRVTIARDLERLTDLLAPIVEDRLASLSSSLQYRVGPVTVPLGEILRSRLQGYPRPMISAALRTLLELSDDELVALIDAVGTELSAWRGFGAPLEAPPPEARRAFDDLVGRAS